MADLIPIVESNETGTRVLAPAVGSYYGYPVGGIYLSAGVFIGRLKILNTIYDLYLPPGIEGIVSIGKIQDQEIQVEYGQELFSLNPDRPKKKGNNTVFGKTDTAEEFHEDGYLLTAFTTGIFYRQSSPDSPPYVKEGQTVEKGEILGLIEVMKTFNHILFQGTGESDTGVVRKIFVQDAQEVQLGDRLFLIK